MSVCFALKGSEMIDPIHDKLIPLSQLARNLPHQPSPATYWRWHSRGIHGIKLEIIRVGGRVYSTEAALAEFIRLTTAAKTTKPNPDTSVRSSAVERQLREANLLDS